MPDAEKDATVEPLQECERCRVMCAPGMACVSSQPGHANAERPCRDPRPATVGTPFHHEDERECYRRADGSGWWPWRWEDGVLNNSGGTICFREHVSACRRCGLSKRAAIAGVLCDPPYAGSHDFPTYVLPPGGGRESGSSR